MIRYFVEYYYDNSQRFSTSIYLYAYSPKQIEIIMDDYKIITIDQTDWGNLKWLEKY